MRVLEGVRGLCSRFGGLVSNGVPGGLRLSPGGEGLCNGRLEGAVVPAVTCGRLGGTMGDGRHCGSLGGMQMAKGLVVERLWSNKGSRPGG